MNTARANKTVLLVCVPSQVVKRLPPILWRESFDWTVAKNPRLATRAIGQLQFSLIITGYPLPRFEFQRFLDDARSFGGPCRSSPLIAFAHPHALDELRQFVGRGLNRAISTLSRDVELERVIASILDVAPRIDVRLPIDLETSLESRGRKMIAQTINVSRSGMLITDPGSLALGERAGFHLEIEGMGRSIDGTVEVVRADRRRRTSAQLGLRIVGIDENDRPVFDAFVDRLLDQNLEGKGG